MSGETLEVGFGDQVIAFALARRARKTLSISVTPECRVEVTAPADAPLEHIYEKVRKRAPWIFNQLRFFAQFQPRTPERRYVAGETHLYLGRQYRLKVALHIQEEVKLHRGFIFVQSHKPRDSAHTQELVERWYRTQAQVKFRERLDLCRQRFPRPDEYKPSGLIVRQLAQRWGSMTKGGKLILNRSLIRASVDAIDYVITHELCHMLHHHHGPTFYQLLDGVMPDWKRRKTKLERQLA